MEQRIVDQATASLPASFPYIPGLLAFREIPSLLEAFANLTVKPDVIICDGQGIAHPRRMGIACHLGLELAIPSVGCAKSRFCGRYDEPGLSKGDWSALYDNSRQIERVKQSRIPNSKFQIPHLEVIGRVLRTRANVRPVFVSPGHLCDIESAARLVLQSTVRYRLPEPIRAAHALAGEQKSSADRNDRHK